jgi:hypothetical protein
MAVWAVTKWMVGLFSPTIAKDQRRHFSDEPASSKWISIWGGPDSEASFCDARRAPRSRVARAVVTTF